ncbi:hypothetical protein TCAL_07901 [Tigriopus californicus]|uniref:Glycosyltransferase 2-like domain-containing protein n=1 Tax=Tigriopus californicus TaxID=6832 RepID=A0A553P6Y8_TIGCA|nr:beta-1,4-mannosyltransferase egh-like [Tigriopus californicus]XP_059079082.1 beta-1,4-mannosyltransferase egh-like [Tigriopus californicus]TRY73453.1 hypothetical protein TCAL_07901 [Tigriopus californicus]
MPEVLLGPAFRHALFVFIFLFWILLFGYFAGSIRFQETFVDTVNPWTEYGVLATCFNVVLRLMAFLAVPQTLFNFMGFIKYPSFPEKIVLKSSPLLAPFVCVRVVTRGLYPNLVKETVRRNLETLSNVGVENYVVQVVTDIKINLNETKRLQEILVPSSYTTKSGALNKSRALQYCLEDDVNILGDDDWIIHLDEETLLTESSVKGILNFINEGKHDFGQGLITYASTPVHFRSWWKSFQNRICTVADSFRVADDLGKIRFQFKTFHAPIFGWKGSYVVTKLGAERKITFDNGPEGSKAEDAFFAMLAMDAGLTFDFIEGEMHEKSPFTFSDFFKQRKRWMQGIYMVVASPLITWATKGLLAMSLVSWLTLPLSTLANLVLVNYYPFSMGVVLDFLLGLVGAIGFFMYGFGYVRQHPIQRYSWIRLLLVVPEIVISSGVSIIAENCAVCTMWVGDWYDFYIVDKELEEFEEIEESQVKPQGRLIETV